MDFTLFIVFIVIIISFIYFISAIQELQKDIKNLSLNKCPTITADVNNTSNMNVNKLVEVFFNYLRK